MKVLGKQVIKYTCAIAMMAISIIGFAHNKVVVIPLGSDEAPTSKKIFWTDEAYNGDLGGLSGADAKCQMSADNAGVQGNFKAWLGVSTGAGSIPGRPDFNYYASPYQNVDGTLVARGFLDFLDGEFEGNICSAPAPDACSGPYWTGMTDSGNYNPLNCLDWESADARFTGGWGHSYGGNSSGFFSWSAEGDVSCSALVHLLCFEQ